MLDFIHLSATGVAEIAESTNLNWCPDTFGHVYTSYEQEDENRKGRLSDMPNMQYVNIIVGQFP